MSAATFVYRLPFATPSQNVYQRWHWAQKKRFRDQCQMHLEVQCRLSPHGRPPRNVKMHVCVTRHSAGVLDYGNLVGGCKPVLDALVRVGLLVDDSPKWVTEAYQQETHPQGVGATDIFITPLLSETLNADKVTASQSCEDQGEATMPAKKKARAKRASKKTSARATRRAGKKKTTKRKSAGKRAAARRAPAAKKTKRKVARRRRDSGPKRDRDEAAQDAPLEAVG